MGWTDYFNENAEGLNLDWLAEDRRQANPDALTYNEFQETRRLSGGFTGTYDLHQTTALDLNAYVRNTHYKESVPSSVQHRTLTPLGATVQLTQRLETGRIKHLLGAGSDVQWQWISEFRHPNLGGAEEGPELLADRPSGRAGSASSCSIASTSAEPGAAWSTCVTIESRTS